MKITKEELYKVINTPGNCSGNELRKAKKFLKSLKEDLNIYIHSSYMDSLNIGTLEYKINMIDKVLTLKDNI